MDPDPLSDQPVTNRRPRVSAYLGGLHRALTHGLTTLLIFLVFFISGARTPWLWIALFILWIAWLVYDGRRQARAPSSEGNVLRPPHVRPFPTFAVVVITIMLAVYGQYLGTTDREFEAGNSAYARGDCQSAKVSYQQAALRYRWALGSNRDAAEAKIKECDAFLMAVKLQEAGEYTKALAAYDAYLKTYPTGLVTATNEGLAQTHIAQADALLIQGNVRDALHKYVLVRQRYPSTAGATLASKNVVDLYIAQVQTPYYEGHPCNALQPLDHFISLSPDEARQVQEVSDNAKKLHPVVLFECGVQRTDSGRVDEARALFSILQQAYHSHPLITRIGNVIRESNLIEKIFNFVCKRLVRACAIATQIALTFHACVLNRRAGNCTTEMSELVATILPIRLR